MKIALAHDSFTQLGGAERVMEDLHQLFPEAPVFTLVLDKKLSDTYKGWDIRTSWLQVFYNIFPKLQYWLFLIPAAVASLDFKNYDVVISSSSSFIKNIRFPKNAIHICYCHTPTRFLWSDSNYVNQEVPAIIRPLVKLFLKWMKKWDYKGGQRVTHFIANSKEVQDRIFHYYQRTSTIVYPGIDTNFWKPTIAKSNYFLLAGRLQAHKNNELIVEIFNELGLPLRIVGTGRQENYLKSIAKTNISFLGKVSDPQLRDEYSGALAYIYPQVEDFGLMPLEAAASGTATIAYGKGGALETIVPRVTGEFFNAVQARGLPDREQIKNLILNWQPEKYKTDALRIQAEKFSKEKFKQQILEFINENSN